MSSISLLCLGFSLLLFLHEVASIDYEVALTKSLLYFEAQRSGKLPPNYRVQWRGDSGLKDGSDAGIDLVGGYYDSGDNVKFGFPMAFTVTMLAWSAVEYEKQLSAKNELSHTLEAIKWGTDYLIKTHPNPDVLYGEVGDGDSDHECWQRPEDMATPRTTFKIDDQHPGADLAGETSAALAAASIAFRSINSHYSSLLLSHAKQLFDFGRNHPGTYQNSIPVAGKFYSSSGYEVSSYESGNAQNFTQRTTEDLNPKRRDELLWAAAWLHRATGDQTYLNYLGSSGNTGGSRPTFSWDDKFFGVQVLVSKLVLEGKVENSAKWVQYKSDAEQFVCSCVQKGGNTFRKTNGGLLWWQQPWNQLQYNTAAMLALTAYSDYLSAKHASINCQGDLVTPTDLITFVKSQVDYILGSNLKGISYMVGFGSKYPEQVHHRGASIVSIKKDPNPVTCKGGFDAWFNKNAPNPNVLEGAIVGGPDENDAYTDSRSNYQQAEPATVTTAPIVGVLAKLA